MKLNSFYKNELKNISYFLFCYASFMNHELSYIYLDYYLIENNDILLRFKNDNHLRYLDDILNG